MNLLQELQDRISAWMVGHATLDDLYLWMASMADDIEAEAQANASLYRLSGRSWNLLARCRAGDITEAQVRDGLLRAGAIAPLQWGIVAVVPNGRPRESLTGATDRLQLVG